MEQTGTEYEEFASALKRRREGAGLSRDELASAVGVSSSTIKALELGARNPSKELSRKLRRVLDINPEAGSTDSISVLNCWIAPGFSALGLLDSLIATVNGPGGSLEQSNLYLDPLSAAASCAACARSGLSHALRHHVSGKCSCHPAVDEGGRTGRGGAGVR